MRIPLLKLPTIATIGASSGNARMLRSGTTAFLSQMQRTMLIPLITTRLSPVTTCAAEKPQVRLSMVRSSDINTQTVISYDPSSISSSDASPPSDATILIGRKERLRGWLGVSNEAGDGTDVDDTSPLFDVLGFKPTQESSLILSSTIDSMTDNNGAGKGSAETTFVSVVPASKTPDGKEGNDPSVLHRLSLCVLPEKVSRNNHFLSVHTITSMISSICSKKIKKDEVDSGTTTRILIDTEGPPSDSTETRRATSALAVAIAKAFPIYSSKSQKLETTDQTALTNTLNVSFLRHSSSSNKTPEVIDDDASLLAAQHLTEGVRLAARLVDTPPAELTTESYAAECRKIAEKLGDRVTFKEIVGEELREKGYGGLYGIGKAAVCPPRMVVMEYTPSPSTDGNDDDVRTVALVGKGIVYDTGGLSLKPKTGMPGMKHDMGGSAAMLGAFTTAVSLSVPTKLVLILCLAENAIGPNAVRNDDILTCYSGRTVEINNTDAEGRVVLADGVAHATKHYRGLNLVVDMATLTGAQLIATGKKHAGVLANTLEWEEKAIKAGMESGDLCFPLLYAPELLNRVFNSKVADMKNSVKDRGNAQSSCAGHFIERHLDEGYKGGWVHVDMAGPASEGERATGWGVGFLCSLLEVPGV